jgi:hypothetical protein
MSDPDREYHRRRREEWLLRAEQASDPAIARLHREFAEEYERRLSVEGLMVPAARS